MTIPRSQKPDFEEVQINTTPFQLFPLDKTQKRFAPVGKKYVYDRKVFLDTNGLLPLLPIRLYAGATHVSVMHAISPYTDDGYQFTGKEHDPKQKAQVSDTDREIDYATAPLCLDASTHGTIFRRLNLTEQSPTLPDPLLPDVRTMLSRIRFHITLPRKNSLASKRPLFDTLVSRPDATALQLGELSFRHFTFQNSPTHAHTFPGYFLVLPSDDTIIQTIQGQFTFEAL